MKPKPYIIQPAHKSRCPACNRRSWLLCPEDPYRQAPMFYLCFQCRKVFQVGVAEVKRED